QVQPPAPPAPAEDEAAAEPADDFDEAPSRFAHEPPFRPRRNPARMWTGMALGLAVVMLGAMGAVARFGLPEWLPFQPGGIGSLVEPDLRLSFPADKQERLALPGGNDYFNISGTITNTGKDRRDVPDVLIVLRDAHNRIVYTAETTPPKTVLAPGESEAINTALVSAPKSATAAEIHWRPR
ncbi:MAG TPA: FxLYD domain-containing protein, partial [Novosphingobium sp.]|nr:FxLYD domain-containing protein [Novosphingobium sp.]